MQEEINFQKKMAAKYGTQFNNYNLKQIYELHFSSEELPNDPKDEDYLQVFADNLIYIYFNYKYEDMPFFDWTTNCFDGRLCEEDYSEKIVDFLRFIAFKRKIYEDEWQNTCPNYIYTTNHDQERHSILNSLMHETFYNCETYIDILNKWGQTLDDFLIIENDYYHLDYLVNAIHKDNEYNVYHLFKTYSLCEMLLVKDTASGTPRELDNKLPLFILNNDTSEKKLLFASIIRRMRNKIGHSDFVGLNKLFEEYAKEFMDDHFWFDYFEYSRQNWILLNICCELDAILARIIYIMLTDKPELERIRKLSN